MDVSDQSAISHPSTSSSWNCDLMLYGIFGKYIALLNVSPLSIMVSINGDSGTIPSAPVSFDPCLCSNLWNRFLI